jgi:hypothetical protein
MTILMNDAISNWIGRCPTFDDPEPMQFPTYVQWISMMRILESG